MRARRPPASCRAAEHSSRRFELGVAQPHRELVDPSRLPLVDRPVLGAANLREMHELRAAVIGVRRKLDQPVGDEAVHGRVHRLTREAHAAGDLGHGERPLRERDRSEHLPARRGQAMLCWSSCPEPGGGGVRRVKNACLVTIPCHEQHDDGGQEPRQQQRTDRNQERQTAAGDPPDFPNGGLAETHQLGPVSRTGHSSRRNPSLRVTWH